MKEIAKQFALNLLPPIVTRGLRLIIPRKSLSAESASPFCEFSENFQSFDEAAIRSVGYNNLSIARGAFDRLEAYLNSNSGTELDSRVQQLASIFSYIICRTKKNISVLDVGGGNGCHYQLLTQLLRCDLDWTVLETPSMTRICRENSKLGVSFVDSETETKPEYDIVLFSGALQYLEKPYEAIDKFRQKSSYLILTRVPVHEDACDRIMIQNVPPHIYDGSFPMHCFSRAAFQTYLTGKGGIYLAWDIPSDTQSWSRYGFGSRGYLIKGVQQ